MCQATLPTDPYLNSNLFSGYYLDECTADLEAKIDRTDELIDEIVYELYGLSDEEIEMVEEAVEE